MRRAWWLPALLALGLAPSPCGAAPPGAPPFTVSVSRDGDDCRMVVLGQDVTGERLSDMTPTAPGARAIVIYDGDTPEKCVAGAVSSLHQAGWAKIDLVEWEGGDSAP